jgi:hypothetical protein
LGDEVDIANLGGGRFSPWRAARAVGKLVLIISYGEAGG